MKFGIEECVIPRTFIANCYNGVSTVTNKGEFVNNSCKIWLRTRCWPFKCRHVSTYTYFFLTRSILKMWHEH